MVVFLAARLWYVVVPAVWWCVLVLGLSTSVVGCAPNRGNVAEDFDQLNGLFIVDDGVYVIPDRGWRREGDHGGSFNKTASLLVYIQNDHPDGLRVRMRAEGSAGGRRFLASWDNHPLWSSPKTAGDEPLVVEIDSSSMAPGLHHLRLERVKDRDNERDGESGRNVFSQVDVERIDQDRITVQPITASPYLARFLEFGVTSQTSTQLSGCLFHGPQSHSIEIDGIQDGEATFTAQNQSRERARFKVSIDGVRVVDREIGPRSASPLSFPVPAGAHAINLEVTGISSGNYLWGSPFLRRFGEVGRTPVILITLDTTRRDVVSPFSDRPELTPNLSRFAADATVYTNAYSTAPWTLPTHASIFTGLFASKHRAGVIDDVLSESWQTLAEQFRRSGYRTAGFVGGSMASSSFGMAQGFDFYRDPAKNEEPADVITDAACQFVEANSESPLFLFLNYFDPHGPYSAPKEFQDRLGVDRLRASVESVPGWAEYARDRPGAFQRIISGDVPSEPSGIALLRARYEAEVAFMDHEIGRFFSSLRDHDLYDRALIVVVADHGEFLGERGLYSHSYRLDPELTSIPMIIKWPGQVGAEVVEELVSQVDLFPTMAAVTGLNVPGSDGILFTRHETGDLDSREWVYLEEHESLFHQLTDSLKVADHLYGMQWLETREVFFPGLIECSRRSGENWIPVRCGTTWEQRIGELPAAMSETLRHATDYDAADLDEDTAESLRALGYLE